MRAMLTSILSLLPLQLVFAQAQSEELIPLEPPLAYVESSSGLGYPSLDGGPIGLEFGDVNQDGFVDILSIGDHGSPNIGTQQHGIMVWFGNGTGAGWSVYMNGDFGYGGIAMGDVNNDGLMDVGYGMHHDYSGNDFGDQLIEVALGDGTGKNWTPWDDGLAVHGQSWGMFDTDFADVEGDGDLDLVSISFGSGDGLHVYLNNGDGTWTRSFGFLNGNSSCEVLFGDVNGDGYPDIASGHQNGTVWLGDGSGNFVNADGNLPPPGSWNHYYGPDLGDVDGDGCQDLSYCDVSGAVRVWLWGGNNRWLPFSKGLPNSAYSVTQLSDMDGDGRLDLAALGKGKVTVWQLDDTDTWIESVTFATGNPGYAESMRADADVDFNGRPDIVVVCEEGSWPYDKNKLHFYKEASEPRILKVRLVYPRGNETFLRGAVTFIDWLGSVPGGGGGTAQVTLKLSTSGPGGPWSIIAKDVPNNGRFQWLIPAWLPPSSDCRVKIRLSTPSGGALYKMSKSFELK